MRIQIDLLRSVMSTAKNYHPSPSIAFRSTLPPHISLSDFDSESFVICDSHKSTTHVTRCLIKGGRVQDAGNHRGFVENTVANQVKFTVRCGGALGLTPGKHIRVDKYGIQVLDSKKVAEFAWLRCDEAFPSDPAECQTVLSCVDGMLTTDCLAD